MQTIIRGDANVLLRRLCVSQVDLKFPKVVSDGARDLISKLLRHSPMNRLPLQSVIDHPWVKANSRRVLPPVCTPKKPWSCEALHSLPTFWPCIWTCLSVCRCISGETWGQLSWFFHRFHCHGLWDFLNQKWAFCPCILYCTVFLCAVFFFSVYFLMDDWFCCQHKTTVARLLWVKGILRFLNVFLY